MSVRSREEFEQIVQYEDEEEQEPMEDDDVAEVTAKMAKVGTQDIDENMHLLSMIQQEDPLFNIRDIYNSMIRNKILRTSLQSDICRRLFGVLKASGMPHGIHMEVYDTKKHSGTIFIDLASDRDALILLKEAGIEGSYLHRSDSDRPSCALFKVDVPLRQFIAEFRIHYETTFFPLIAARMDYEALDCDMFDPHMLDLSHYRFV